MEKEELNQLVLDKLTKVCLCKGISRATMKKAIIGGADTLEKVQKATGAGSGSCHGNRCTPKIEELLRAAKENQMKLE
ncbi:MAG: domain protein (2Fe-2S)-binding domain protein [Massilibacillus sp.]|nr:domain protein (2Fe-2S)-binding domain protein [Massilibacillus sp.]